MNRTDRLYAIAEHLRAASPDGVTAERMASRFEVSTRTIKRDVASLQQAGLPIWATAGPGGGYAIDRAATLPPLAFSPGEATAIAVAPPPSPTSRSRRRDGPRSPRCSTPWSPTLGRRRRTSPGASGSDGNPTTPGRPPPA